MAFSILLESGDDLLLEDGSLLLLESGLPPTPESGGGFAKPKKFFKTVRASAVFDGGGEFAVTRVTVEFRESDDEVLIILL